MHYLLCRYHSDRIKQRKMDGHYLQNHWSADSIAPKPDGTLLSHREIDMIENSPTYYFSLHFTTSVFIYVFTLFTYPKVYVSVQVTSVNQNLWEQTVEQQTLSKKNREHYVTSIWTELLMQRKH